ncbi:sulfite exporter TauE/SafE family protein [Liquorilactobacillus vini]|uniref:sulfite exporter TauE/SafE family protein n=1 Tax=Liquorilactobacillus vini TaxID=238015 RepID=UPI000303B3A5|nr:sulfite exporter TauE/SafE family protein [Liquorilactobacillus vini]
MTGVVYFVVIVLANSLGAVSGMGGGVIIKPVFDFIGANSVVEVSFYSAVAVFVMSIVSTIGHLKNGFCLKWLVVLWVSLGALIGGMVGDLVFSKIVAVTGQRNALLVQVILTIITLLFAMLYTRFNWQSFNLEGFFWYLLCGITLGFFASLLGIGGGPINVALLMWMFGIKIKDATVYSICTIFFSQLSKILTIAFTTGFAKYDTSMLMYIIPAAIVGGLVGSRLSKVLSAEKVVIVFQLMILTVILINVYNGIEVLI